MQISKFRIYRALIAGGLGIAVAVAIAIDAPIIALVAVVVAIILAFIQEHRNKEVVRDDRISLISEKATYASFISMIILAAVTTLGIALFRSHLPENVVFAGTIMGYFVCVALLLHMFFYVYFSRKL